MNYTCLYAMEYAAEDGKSVQTKVGERTLTVTLAGRDWFIYEIDGSPVERKEAVRIFFEPPLDRPFEV